jgi:hypothetical protein
MKIFDPTKHINDPSPVDGFLTWHPDGTATVSLDPTENSRPILKGRNAHDSPDQPRVTRAVGRPATGRTKLRKELYLAAAAVAELDRRSAAAGLTASAYIESLLCK